MNKITIFNTDNYNKDIQASIKNLVSGKTPLAEVRKKPGKGGQEENYVNGYYMFRQVSLITGFRWSSKCIKERFFPDEINPSEVGALMEVEIHDQSGNIFSHQSWGSSDIKRYEKDKFNKDGKKIHNAGDTISIFNDLKSAYTDGIKKCLSYFGIANDIYGGKELNYFEETESDGQVITMTADEGRAALDAYIRKNKVRYDKALEIIGVSSLNEITDYPTAYQKIKTFLGGGIIK